MKKSIIVIAAIIMMAGFTTKSFAQQFASASNTANAKIVAALTLTAVTPLDFGTMSVPTAPVNVSVSTTSGRTSSVLANIDLLIQDAPPTAAAYTVGGETGYAYAITLPANGVVTISNGTVSMAVNGFNAETASEGTGLAGTIISSGDNFTVGATLVLGTSQAAGTYAGSFNVTVAYN